MTIYLKFWCRSAFRWCK